MSDSSSTANPQRWWEGYLVRYFLGFIVGIICIAILGIQTIFSQEAWFSARFSMLSSTQGGQSGRSLDLSATPIAIAISLLGMAYCYIASSPITVLHSTRMMKTWFHRHSRSFWMAWAVVLTFRLIFSKFFESYNVTEVWLWMGLAVTLLLLILPRRTTATGSTDTIKGKKLAYNVALGAIFILFALLLLRSHVEVNISLAAFALPVLWIMFGQYWTLFALLHNDNDEFLSFYKKLSIARQKPRSRDIRDSYTHLREHANSVFVVLIELCILAGLIAIHQITSTNVDLANPLNVEFSYWSSVLVITGIWLVPTVFMWSLANRLEKTFANKSEDFMDNSLAP